MVDLDLVQVYQCPHLFFHGEPQNENAFTTSCLAKICSMGTLTSACIPTLSTTPFHLECTYALNYLLMEMIVYLFLPNPIAIL